MPFLCLIAAFLSFQAQSSVVARVNGEPLFREALQKQMLQDQQRGVEPKQQQVLENLILYKLALQKARSQKLHLRADVNEEMNKVLYRAFLAQTLENAKTTFSATPRQLQELYSQWPWIRLRHLVLMGRNPTEKARAKETLESVMGELKKGAAFSKLVLKYSEDPQAVANGGDLDFVGHQSLAPEFYSVAKELKVGEVSTPIFHQDAFHVFELTQRSSFEAAPATYKQYLAGFYRSKKENEYLTKTFKELRARAEVAILTETEGKSE